jgi:hypothetical protein
MHVGNGFLRKVHYNALFGDGKREEKLSTQSRSFGSRDTKKAASKKTEEKADPSKLGMTPYAGGRAI